MEVSLRREGSSARLVPTQGGPERPGENIRLFPGGGLMDCAHMQSEARPCVGGYGPYAPNSQLNTRRPDASFERLWARPIDLPQTDGPLGSIVPAHTQHKDSGSVAKVPERPTRNAARFAGVSATCGKLESRILFLGVSSQS
jgi:hypothetical protein